MITVVPVGVVDASSSHPAAKTAANINVAVRQLVVRMMHLKNSGVLTHIPCRRVASRSLVPRCGAPRRASGARPSPLFDGQPLCYYCAGEEVDDETSAGRKYDAGVTGGRDGDGPGARPVLGLVDPERREIDDGLTADRVEERDGYVSSRERRGNLRVGRRHRER